MVAVIAIGVILGFNPFGSNVPEGVDINEALYELVPANTEVFVLDEGVTRQFISRDRNTLWITEDTAEKIGVDASAE